MRRLIPHSRLQVLRGTYHNPMVDAPEAFNQAVLSILAGEDEGK